MRPRSVPSPSWLRSDADWVSSLARRHRADPEVISRILTASVGQVGRWPVYEEAPLSTWHRHSAAVLGDAAHAVAPHLGQGAALGMEDAYELAPALDAHEHPEDAFAGFEALRRDRIAAMSKQAQRTGAVMTPKRWIVRVTRDLILPKAIKQGVKKGTEAYRLPAFGVARCQRGSPVTIHRWPKGSRIRPSRFP